VREGWQTEFQAKAETYWTAERTAELTGGKTLLILPGPGALLLRALGLLHRDASMPPRQVRKWRQINHMVSVLGPSWRELKERFSPVFVLDAGCGGSYLTVLLAWVFEHVYQHPIRVLGVDRNADLIAECRRRAEIVGLEHVLKYRAAAIDSLEPESAWAEAYPDAVYDATHAVIGLHACDTATDDAIALGFRLRANVIAVAPCCHAELAAGWRGLAQAESEGAFAPIWRSPHLRRKSGAEITDAMRALLMKAAGYDVTALEFVASEHTPKNTLLRGLLRGGPDDRALREYEALRDATGGTGISLERGRLARQGHGPSRPAEM